jgi:adenosylcobinamide-GDP ribazoletransferase
MTPRESPPEQRVGQPNLIVTLLQPLGEALRFMTIIPQPWLPPGDEQTMLRALPWFPLVGLLIGLLLLPIGWAALQIWGTLAAAALLVVIWAVISGGLHLDGLSDTFDAVMSWRPRTRKLEIMKDSRIGAMGTLAIVAVLLLKVTMLAETGALWWQGLLLAPLLGRWADLCAIAWFPAAAEGGFGHAFHDQLRRSDVVVTTVLSVAASLLIAGMVGLVAMLLVALTTLLLGRWWTQDLGGLTGDTYGALCELAEVVVLATIAAAL